jgi:hypothetical protein
MRVTGLSYLRRPAWAAPGLALLLLAGGPARGEDAIDWGREPLLAFDLGAEQAASPAVHPDRIRLFRIAPAFLSDPIGLADPDDPTGPDDAGSDWLQASIGNDNPFFDVRRPGDPGGVGYYRLHTQMQLLDSPHTGCALGLQAVTPAGRDNDGVDAGPTVLSPSLSLFHALDDGTAFQGFVGKHVHLDSGLGGRLGQSVQYGMAVQRPLLPAGPDGAGVYVFMEALGRYRYESQAAAAAGTGHVMELLPGLHWQLAPNWWMSGAVVLPVNTAPTSVNQWQITCSFHF